MIRTLCLKKGKLATFPIDETDRIVGEYWIDGLSPSRQELKDISEKTGIPYEDLSRAQDENERPGTSEFEEFSIITFHAPYQNKLHNYLTTPVNIFIKGETVVILRNKHVESVDSLFNLDDSKKVEILREDVTFTLYMLLSEVINHFFRVSDELEIEIDKIEDSVFKTQNKNTVKRLFVLKKTLIYFHKSLTGNREVITGIEKQFIKELKGKNIKKFRYLYADTIQLIEMIGTYREVLSSSLDIYLTSVSNNLNEVMKRLTVITSFVLVPTLISGIYGMNFKYMPEIHDFGRWGYPFALSLMILSVIGVYFYFKKKEWI